MAVTEYRVFNQCAFLTMARTAKRNALNGPLLAELRAHVQTASADPEVRALVLAADGPSFCAGADLSEEGAEGSEATTTELAGFLAEWLGCSKPTIAQVQGPVAGGGNGLAAACDVVVASTSATFALREVRVGVVPALISVPLLQRLSPAKLRELALTGRRIDAIEAREIGLVDWAAAPDRLKATVQRVADDFVKGAPKAQAETKRWLRMLTEGNVADRLGRASELSAELFTSDEAVEGMRAFREKRHPSW